MHGLPVSGQHQSYTANCTVITVAQDCKNVIETSYWCHISSEYALVYVSKTQPGRIICTIPHSTGQDIFVTNQFGAEVRLDPTLRNYAKQTSGPSTNHHTDSRSYTVELYWTPDSDIQERLRIIQCEVFFHNTNYICKTSVVNVHFEKEPEGM